MLFRLLRSFRPSTPPAPHDRDFRIRLLYTEFVRGERKTFRHEISVEARTEGEAIGSAVRHFHESAARSNVGWQREIDAVQVRIDGNWRGFPWGP